MLPAVCVIIYKHVSQKDAFVPPRVAQQTYCVLFAAPSLSLSLSHTHTHTYNHPPTYTHYIVLQTCIFLTCLTESLFLSCTHIHHTGSGRKWGSCEQSGMTHCSPCTCPLAAAPTHNSLRRAKAPYSESSYQQGHTAVLFILACFTSFTSDICAIVSFTLLYPSDVV